MTFLSVNDMNVTARTLYKNHEWPHAPQVDEREMRQFIGDLRESLQRGYIDD